MSGKGSFRPSGRRVAKSGGRLSQAESIRRQQQIVRLREVEQLTFARIAEQVGLGEKETRLCYYRYIDEVAPLLTAPSADAEIAEALRRLDGLAQCALGIAERETNGNARVGAVRTAADLIFRTIKLRQHLGLLPRPISRVVDNAWMAEQIERIFVNYQLPAEAFEEILRVFRDSGKDHHA